MKNAKLTVAIYEGWHHRRRWQNQEKHESKQHQRFDGKNQILDQIILIFVLF